MERKASCDDVFAYKTLEDQHFQKLFKCKISAGQASVPLIQPE